MFGRMLNTPKARKPSGPAPALKVEQRVGVQAPAETIWALLADIDRWGTWNPTYPQASGTLGIGKALQLTLVLPGFSPRELSPTIIDWVPYEQILWTEAPALWVRTVRYIEIEQADKTSCIISNGEQIQGFFAEGFHAKHRRAMKAGFIAMNEALKESAEAIWADKQVNN